MGLRLTTKVQVSGWRFLLRRLEHAIVRRDTRMFDDPLQFYSRSIALGIVVAVLILAGAALLAYFKPQGKLGGTSLFTDRATNQLYVLLSGQLHPVYNLTSARLVLGNPANPATVKSSELSKLPMGQTVGIPGAPYATPVSAGSTSIWTLCDTVARADSTSPVVQTAVIAIPLEIDASIDPLQSHEAVLVSYQGETWIVTTKGRHAIDLTDRALTSSMGIPVTARPTPISEGMFNALPDMGPWQLPPIPAAGAPNSLGLPDDLVIGSVFQIHTDKGPQWLPHVQHQTETDAAGSTRLIFTRQEGLSDLAARGPHAPDSLPGGPYVVVVDLTGGKAGFPPDGRAGVTVITLGNHRGSAYRIRVHEDGTADDRLPNQSFRQVTSVTDRMSPQQASRIARKLAGWSITGTILDKTSRVQKKVATDWHQLVGAQSVEEITPSRWRMYTDTDRDRLKIPFGHELKTGNVMYLDIKEGAEFGAGPHGMLIGTTGSGKSEFLRTLILSLVAMTHPDQVNLLLTDFKGGSTFLGMEKLPHTAAVVTNMAEEAELVSRMGEVLTGELDRRQSILRQAGMKVGAAGALSGVAEYEKYRERGADLPPLPTLFVVVDEFAELLQSHPDFIGLFDRICRVGRSLRVHLLLATQSLQTGGVRIDKLEPNLTYRIALRTTSSHESKAVIGTPEAQYITNKESGVGFLRVGMEDPVKFSTFYISGPYMPPAAGVETNGEAGGPGQQTTRQAARIHRFTAAPVLEEAPTP